MLKKRNRVNTKMVEKIFNRSVSIRSSNLIFKFIFLENSKTPTFSFIVPKNVAKNATQRNLLRRRGAAILKRYLKKLPNNLAGVFIFGKRSPECFAGGKNKNYNPTQNLENEIKNIFSKIN